MGKHHRHGRAEEPLRASQTHDLIGNEEYEQALEALSRMRQGWSLTQASLAVGTTPRIVKHYVGSALQRDENGRWEPKANDRLHRRMRFLDERGVYPVEPADAREAGKLSAYWHAVHHFLTTGDAREVAGFWLERLRTRQGESLPFVTDRHQLARLGYAGELRFEDLYQH
jgi:hypothetical protein